MTTERTRFILENLQLIASYIFIGAAILGGGTAIGWTMLLFYYMPVVTLLPLGFIMGCMIITISKRFK